jgi:hypothetical protein
MDGASTFIQERSEEVRTKRFERSDGRKEEKERIISMSFLCLPSSAFVHLQQ